MDIGIELPKSWAPMPADKDFIIVDLPSGTGEYAKVEADFIRTGGLNQPAQKGAYKIIKVTSPFLCKGEI